MNVSVSRLAAAIEAKPRTIQLWADFGILRPTKATQGAGTGAHRLFPVTEVRVAAMLMPLAGIGTPRGVLKRVADLFRRAITSSGQVRGLRAAADRAIADRGQNYLHYVIGGDNAAFCVVTDEKGAPRIDPAPNAMFVSLAKHRRSHVGIIDLNVALRGLVG